MSQADRIDVEIAELEAKKELAVLEDEIIVKKAAGTATVEDKIALRAARQYFRENIRTANGPGASPAAIGVEDSN